ncbi:uncharacterized protein C1orf50 homolog [Apostichopus japonicus]|uniref:uncharacterized protein C1orf50 homolog n=1 Tax=Stichopus japonicus TaxID=307972 RepID=UPI003AB50263
MLVPGTTLLYSSRSFTRSISARLSPVELICVSHSINLKVTRRRGSGIISTANMDRTTSAVALVEPESQPSGVQLVNTDRTNKMTDPMDLVALAEQVQKGDDFVKAVAGNKLMLIAEQIRHLQDKARQVLEEAKRDADLHHAACNIKKRPGHMYYLYLRDSGQRYFSILSPDEWGSSCPHEFIGAYRLEYDMTWTLAKDFERRGEEYKIVHQILSKHASLEYFPDSKMEGMVKDGVIPDKPSSGE